MSMRAIRSPQKLFLAWLPRVNVETLSLTINKQNRMQETQKDHFNVMK